MVNWLINGHMVRQRFLDMVFVASNGDMPTCRKHSRYPSSCRGDQPSAMYGSTRPVAWTSSHEFRGVRQRGTWHRNLCYLWMLTAFFSEKHFYYHWVNINQIMGDNHHHFYYHWAVKVYHCPEKPSTSREVSHSARNSKIRWVPWWPTPEERRRSRFVRSSSVDLVMVTWLRRKSTIFIAVLPINSWFYL